MTIPDKEVSNQISFTQELVRKATHLGALIVPGGYYALGLEKSGALSIMIPITILMVLVDIARLRKWWLWEKLACKILAPIIRPHELEGDFTGATYILITFCLTIALFSKPIAIAASAFIIVGDALAAVIGRRFGRHKFNRSKSIEGSLGCLLGTFFVAILAPGMDLTVAISGAFVATVVEAYSLQIDDNVSVPLVSGLFMTLFEKFWNHVIF